MQQLRRRKPERRIFDTLIEREKLVERARTLGEEATARFKKMATQYDVIGDVRGLAGSIGARLD